MSTVLAAIDDTAAAAPVLRASRALARLLDGEVRAFHVTEGTKRTAVGVAEQAGFHCECVEGQPISCIVQAAAATDVAVVVVGARGEPSGPRPVGHVALAVVESVHKPVLVVPPDVEFPEPNDRPHRALVPLDGRPDSAEAVATTLHRLARVGVEIVALHVFVPDDMPRFWDQAVHEQESWAAEFAATWCAVTGVEVRLRTGGPPATVIDVAGEEDVDLIALAWSQHLSSGRAEVVREALARATVPVLLVPVTASDAPPPNLHEPVP